MVDVSGKLRLLKLARKQSRTHMTTRFCFSSDGTCGTAAEIEETSLGDGNRLAATGPKPAALIIIFAVLSLLTGFAASGKGALIDPDNPNSTSNQMRITIGSSTFRARLYDNATATAFKGMLPMTINMSELNGNEKYFDLPVNLPTNASNPGTIESGDLMIYGSKTLVLFYKTFSTSYGYTRLGRINDTKGLASAVGPGSVTVTYELE
jgi:hypothetical protein